jgi:hypothetical protein
MARNKSRMNKWIREKVPDGRASSVLFYSPAKVGVRKLQRELIPRDRRKSPYETRACIESSAPFRTVMGFYVFAALSPSGDNC